MTKEQVRTVTVQVDVDLLRQQRDFLLNRFWETKTSDGTDEGSVPEQVDGVINLLDYMLDVAEGFA